MKYETPSVVFCKAYGLNPNDVIGFNRDADGEVTFTVKVPPVMVKNNSETDEK